MLAPSRRRSSPKCRRHRQSRSGSSLPPVPAGWARPRDRRGQLGLRGNARQFVLLVALNALVGGMVGLERSVLPLVGKRDFGLRSTAAILAFVVAFGAAKALGNLVSGELAERIGRKRLLVIGWAAALPV